MIKSYSDLQQSKKLAEILPLESADMYYEPSVGFRTEPSEAKVGDIKYAHPRSIRCWSLAALLDVLPNESYIVKGQSDDKDERYMCTVGYKNDILSTFSDNPVDACYELILNLHELKML